MNHILQAAQKMDVCKTMQSDEASAHFTLNFKPVVFRRQYIYDSSKTHTHVSFQMIFINIHHYVYDISNYMLSTHKRTSGFFENQHIIIISVCMSNSYLICVLCVNNVLLSIVQCVYMDYTTLSYHVHIQCKICAYYLHHLTIIILRTQQIYPPYYKYIIVDNNTTILQIYHLYIVYYSDNIIHIVYNTASLLLGGG